MQQYLYGKMQSLKAIIEFKKRLHVLGRNTVTHCFPTIIIGQNTLPVIYVSQPAK